MNLPGQRRDRSDARSERPARRAATRRAPLLAAAVLAAAALAGCGSTVGLDLSADTAASSSASSSWGATSASSSSSTDMSSTQSSDSSDSSSSSTGASMDMSSGSSSTSSVPEVNGVKPVATKVLSTSYWQGMKIQVETTTPTTFLEDVGTTGNGDPKFREVKANKHESFHLMVMLSDEHTGELIPYASVWATITDAKGKTVFNSQQWPMISAYMGAHYGNNVTLPGPGKYTLSLLISPPQVARHLEYAHVWLTKHTVTSTFTWKPIV